MLNKYILHGLEIRYFLETTDKIIIEKLLKLEIFENARSH